ncbi:MAG TPA: DNA polymerase III subunit delta' [Gemmataceae bacterium]|nr:DNA polymerase III subunit delta' [Gemmataceae bacterium]
MSWKRVRGHDVLVGAFERAVRRGRLAHAYLFAGPPGVGKRLFASELAKTLLCEDPPAGRFDSCDRCPACVQVDAGTHPDYFQAGLPPDKHEWPIELMRELLRGFALKSARGKGKVAVLDDADDFNEESANAFLKTLEEPPLRSVIILIGTSPERQLATILSRCQVVRFAPLPEPIVIDLLRAQGVEDAALVRRVARLSGGSPGQARALADPALWEFRRNFLRQLSAPQIDSVGLARAWNEFVEEAGKESAAQRQRATLVLRLVIDFLNDTLRVQLGEAPRLAEPDEVRTLETLANRLDADRTLATLERCLQGDTQIDRRVQLALILEALTDDLGERLRAP